MKPYNYGMKIPTICPICGKQTDIEVEFDDFILWKRRNVLIQHAFPYLSIDEREMLITGVCPKCWNEMLKRSYDND